tara:strand:- start:115 stop:651 length:537 start_codon:yes stop_codon:yes gene_type:complete
MKYLKYIINLFVIFFKKLVYKNTINSHTNSISLNSNIYNTVIGKYNYLGPGVVINDSVIQNYCSIAPNVVIGGMEHDYSNFSTSTKLYSNNKVRTTIIEDDVWIGANVVIRTGLIIGKGSIIGASAVVLNDIPPLSIVVGNPGRVLKSRFSEKDKIKKYNSIDFSNNPDLIKLNLNKL